MENSKNEEQVLVIGGGVTGMSASLDLADQGHSVYLIEKSPSIGGKMSQLDKTFPTLDCSICILAPKMVECSRHPRINLLTFSEVTEVTPIRDGAAFKVKVLCKPRYIDEDKCTGCGNCAEICPVRGIPNLFDAGLKYNHAAYTPFLQAVPAIYNINDTRCLYLNHGICGLCYNKCEADAIDFEQKPKEIEIEVASIVVATGFDLMDVTSLKRYGYGKYPNVVTSIEYERIMCASGPSKGEIVRPSDRKHLHKLGLILCVGSRNENLKPYCSRICCMYATKEAIMTMEHYPDAEILVYYNDLRTIGKNHNEFIERAKDEYRVHFIKGLPNKIYENPDTKDIIIRHTDFANGEVNFETVDMVVLYPAVIPSRGAKKLAEILGVQTDEYGFIKPSSSINNIETSIPGIYSCGSVHGPEDISTCVAEASGAASKAASRTTLKIVEKVEEEIVERKVSKDDPPRIGVFICHCGSNIAGTVDVVKVAAEIEKIPDVVYVERNLYTCSEESQNSIAAAVDEHDLNRVIIAACTPRTHLPLFQGTCHKAGLNPYLVLFASIRELVSWVHMLEVEKGTLKAKDHISMAIAKSRYIEPLSDIEVSVLPTGLVIGGGIAGMTSALAIAAKGFKVYLVEKEEYLGGFLRNLNTINFHQETSEKILTPMIEAIKTNPNIEFYTSSIVSAVNGSIGHFQVTIDQKGNEKIVEVGTIVVAVGGQEFKPVGYYNYKENKDVFTSLEFEDLIKNKQLNDGESIAFIQCVGSREADGRTYCSLTCCGNSIKNALAIKDEYPNSQVYIIYRDIRVTFEEEIYYRKAREKGINFIQYKSENPPVLKNGGNLVLEVSDTLSRKKFELSLDKLVLASALIPWPENKTLSKFLKVPIDGNGFFFEAHPKLRPIDFATDGIFVCGTCQGPKNIIESMGQALGTASRSLIPLMNGRAVVDGATSCIPEYNKSLCSGCEVCITVCPYKAINKNEEGEIEITEVLCKGCGVCGATCVNHVIEIRHFTDEQILSEIYAYGGREA